MNSICKSNLYRSSVIEGPGKQKTINGNASILERIYLTNVGYSFITRT